VQILALETSSEYCSVALSWDGRTVARDIHAGQRHSELLLGMVDALLAECGTTLDRVDGIAYGEGPGSFTGLRIACGVAQGLAAALDVPAAGISTLLALAAAADAGRVVCCIDARMNEVYHAAYERSGDGWIMAAAPSLCAAAAAPAVRGAGWTGCGSGFKVYGETLSTRYPGQLDRVLADAFPHAREMALLAVPIFRAGGGHPAAEAAPLYIRDKVALRTDERPA
jgi:tRNA threonylcarbamoyladenosine biosynthesis protein TsaB